MEQLLTLHNTQLSSHERERIDNDNESLKATLRQLFPDEWEEMYEAQRLNVIGENLVGCPDN